MAITIYRGSTPTIKLTPTNGMSVSDLGTPKVAIVQDLVLISPEPTVSAVDNTVSVSLTEEETMRLVPGVVTKIQQVWENDGNVIRFPVHEITVAETILDIVTPEETEETVEEL